MIGTTAALLTSAAIGAGTSLIGAKISSNAAKNAAKIQQDSAQQAYQAALQAYQQGIGFQMPYYTVGTNALTTLGRLMTPPGGSRFAAPAPVMPPGYGIPGAGVMGPQMPTVRPPQIAIPAVRAGMGIQPSNQQSPFMVM